MVDAFCPCFTYGLNLTDLQFDNQRNETFMFFRSDTRINISNYKAMVRNDFNTRKSRVGP